MNAAVTARSPGAVLKFRSRGSDTGSMSCRAKIVACVLILSALVGVAAAGVAPGSQLIECDRADERITLSVDSHLDPSCTWTRGIRIVASGVTLDCQDALIASTTRRYGIEIEAPLGTALSNVTIRNCRVDGFLNSARVTREGFRDLAEGVEYENALSGIVIEDSVFTNSRGVGVFVDGYVTGVTLRRLHIENAGSTGVYLETGSKDNLVEDNTIVNNGYRENGPNGQLYEFSGLYVWYWGPGREGLAIDGARSSIVRNNYFSGNSAGGVFVYKNCGEYPERDRYFERRYGSHDNLIEGNTFVGSDNGVWVGSRMAENTFPMNCTDPEYLPGYRLDYAYDNVVRGNVFQDVTYGIRVEDDRITVEDNIFTSADPAHVAILFGTPVRTAELGLPVDGTVVTGNRASIAGNVNPYRWVHGHVNTTFADNWSHDRRAGVCEGVEPARGPFVMSVAIQVIPDPDNPPVVDPPPTLPLPDPLPPCPMSCASGAAAESPRLVVRGLTTPPGDDRMVLRGELTLPPPRDPEIDPVETGVGLLVEDANGGGVLDVLIPGGTYDRDLRSGWTALRNRNGWRYVDRGDQPPGGIRKIVIHERSPGTFRFSVAGRRGAYPVAADALPLTAIVSLDPPTAETGQCAELVFPASDCRRTPQRVTCR